MTHLSQASNGKERSAASTNNNGALPRTPVFDIIQYLSRARHVLLLRVFGRGCDENLPILDIGLEAV